MQIDIEVVAVPTPGAAVPTDGVFHAVGELTRRWHLAVLGFDDLAESGTVVAAAYAEQAYRRKRLWVARFDGAVVGTAFLALPVRDNRTVAEGDYAVLPELPAELATEVADRLWQATRQWATEHGRTSVQLWTAHAVPTAQADLEWVEPATGVGRIPIDATTRDVLRWGFRLEQAERHSVLDTVDSAPHWPALRQDAEAHSGEYETVTWTGSTPEELIDQMALLRARMSVDVPSGEFDLEEEVWDADRIRHADQVSQKLGRTSVTAVARHRSTGQLAAYTQMDLPAEKPQVAYQGDTLVHGEHRGRRLGMLVKVAGLELLQEQGGQVRRVHTWNAGENAHMLAINTAVGFRLAGLEGGWQRRLPPVSSRRG